MEEDAVMPTDSRSFFEAMIGAGAILAGFCGTFLSFRIQREANYYRQPAVDYQGGKGRDVNIGLQHFTSAFFLLLLGTLCSTIFGFLFPLFALAGSGWVLAKPSLVVGGLVAALVFVAAYFLDELVHYKILSCRRLGKDVADWKGEWVFVVVGVLLAVAGGCTAYYVFKGAI
ncbi:MAG: hypothetical protein HY647_03680 [Acidobacteria bacterium]|nr:hypothetical protein [Acidobacteriota bacterium]